LEIYKDISLLTKKRIDEIKENPDSLPEDSFLTFCNIYSNFLNQDNLKNEYIETKTQDGCRILLNRSDLLRLQDLEWSIHETVVRKTNIIRPTVIRQFELIGNYIDGAFTKVETPPKTNEEMTIFIKNLKDEMIGDTRGHLSYVSQLKMLATTQLVDRWAQRWIAEKTPEVIKR